MKRRRDNSPPDCILTHLGPVQDAAIIDAGKAITLGEKRLKPRHLRLGKPGKIAHRSGLIAGRESREKSEINESRNLLNTFQDVQCLSYIVERQSKYDIHIAVPPAGR